MQGSHELSLHGEKRHTVRTAAGPLAFASPITERDNKIQQEKATSIRHEEKQQIIIKRLFPLHKTVIDNHCTITSLLPALLHHLKALMGRAKQQPQVLQQVRREAGSCLALLPRAYGNICLSPPLIQILFRPSTRTTHRKIPPIPRDCI